MKFVELIKGRNERNRIKKNLGQLGAPEGYIKKILAMTKGKTDEEVKDLFEMEQGTIEYAEMLISCGKVLDDELANKLIDSGYWKRVKQNLSKFKSLDEKTINRIEIFEKEESERIKKEREENEKKEKERQELINNFKAKLHNPDILDVEKLGEFGGSLAYKIKVQTKEGPKYYMFWNDELCKLGIRDNHYVNFVFDEICDVYELGGKMLAKVKVYGGYSIIRGNEVLKGYGYRYRHDEILDIKAIGGKPCVKVKDRNRQSVIRGDKETGCHDDIGAIYDDSGKPLFMAKDRQEGKCYLFRGTELIVSGEYDNGHTSGYKNLDRIGFVGGLPVFKRFYTYTGYEGRPYSLYWGHIRCKCDGGCWPYIRSVREDYKGNLVVYYGNDNDNLYMCIITKNGEDGKIEMKHFKL